MEVKPGYKQTVLGVFPGDWEIDALGHFWGVTDCKHVTARFTADGYPVASIMEVQSRFLDLSGANRTTQRFYNLLTEGGRKPRVGDLILSRNATVGEVAQVAEWHPSFAMGQDVCLLRKKAAGFSTNYLQAVFDSPIIANQLSDLMVGSTFKRINIQQIRNLMVPMPPPAEQEAIAEALSDADALIESLEQLLAKKRQIKLGAMQELLTGTKRLPDFSGEWEIRELGEVCVKIQDGTHFSPKLGGSDFLYITSKNIGYGVLDVSTAGKISAEEHAKICARCDVTTGDLLLTKDGANTGNAALNTLDEPFSLLSSVAMLRFDNRRHSAAYFLYQILSPDGQRQIKERMSGNAITRLTLLKIRLLRFPVVTLDEQTAIAAILSDMDAEIAALEGRLTKARQLKQGMMQELLTGRIRLV